MTDALEWWCVAAQSISQVTHYLDDFALIGPPESEICARDGGDTMSQDIHSGT